ncbi:MAG: hypothetical protein IJ196_02315 [Prevotella sp.]|nr:hypothetical protein [Prevotella sp.]
MKKMYNLMMMLMAGIMTMSLSSCYDEDEAIAYHLAGQWDGMITDMRGRRFDVTMYFDQHNNSIYANYGTGYEIDRGWQGRTSHIGFDWKVRDGEIYINYYDGTRVVVDYDNLPYNNRVGTRFTGYFVDWDTGETLAEFYLIRVD